MGDEGMGAGRLGEWLLRPRLVNFTEEDAGEKE